MAELEKINILVIGPTSSGTYSDHLSILIFYLPSSDIVHKQALDVWFSLQKILLGLERIL
jgi:hypothetical protein